MGKHNNKWISKVLLKKKTGVIFSDDSKHEDIYELSMKVPEGISGEKKGLMVWERIQRYAEQELSELYIQESEE